MFKTVTDKCVRVHTKYIKGHSYKVFIKPQIHGQINLIKFIESNKFENVYCKI